MNAAFLYIGMSWTTENRRYNMIGMFPDLVNEVMRKYMDNNE